MKNINQSKTLLFAALLLGGLLTFSSCKDKDPIDPGTGTFEFHLHNYIGDNEVEDYGTIYTTTGGREVSLDLAQLYLSHIQLVKKDGSTYDVSGVKILKEQDEDVYSLGEVPAGDYKTVRFRLGFDDADNKLVPSTNATLLNNPEMWFGGAFLPADGYVFLHVKGTVDPTADASGTVAQMQHFEYKLGTSSNYIQVTLPEKPFTVVKDQVNLTHLLADYSVLFEGIDLTQTGNLSVLTAADNSIMPGTWLTLNVENLFRYEDE